MFPKDTTVTSFTKRFEASYGPKDERYLKYGNNQAVLWRTKYEYRKCAACKGGHKEF